jgi:hypothetical protein
MNLKVLFYFYKIYNNAKITRIHSVPCNEVHPPGPCWGRSLSRCSSVLTEIKYYENKLGSIYPTFNTKRKCASRQYLVSFSFTFLYFKLLFRFYKEPKVLSKHQLVITVENRLFYELPKLFVRIQFVLSAG